MTNNPFLDRFRPYIPASVTNLRELTIFPLLIGTILGIVFGASSLYLVLKTGLTVSASIPVAVIAITLFRLLSKFGLKDATILESNVMQTAGSAGESIAFGVGVTMPAIMILGFDLELWRVMLVAVLGGLLGILMMIPLRRALIKEQHGFLKYPEGTACAEVLKAGASKESREASQEGGAAAAAAVAATDDSALQGGKIISIGFAIGFAYNALLRVFSFWNPEPQKIFTFNERMLAGVKTPSENTLKAGKISLESDPTLLGVGYIIGPYISSIMMGGGVLSYLVLIPLIKYFGMGLDAPLAPSAKQIINTMEPDDVRGAYILYIGAGAVATAGIISLFRSLPTIWSGVKSGLGDLMGSGAGGASSGGTLERTDQDLSMKWVVVGVLGLLAAIMLFPQLGLSVFVNPIASISGALLIVLLGFLFVTVSSRLTGEVGSSSNPISGMTVATLLITCLVFLALGWTQPNPYFVTALSIGGIVCIASSNGGTTSQDLKTGFLVGATPRNQQIAILVGALASAIVMGALLLFLNSSETYYKKIDDKIIAADFRVREDQLSRDGAAFASERVQHGKYESDQNNYRVWHNTDEQLGMKGKYLIDTQGKPVYYVDPAINGNFKVGDDGEKLTRYSAPKATLMSYIIQGILSQKLPWGLVLIGAMIAIVLELSTVPALAFAVGLYLSIGTSAPIFVGGMVRYAVDIYLRRRLARRNLTEDEIIAETDKSNGVLLASGYIAGGAIAGILIAIFAVVPALKDVQEKFGKWAETSNPFFAGANADWLGMIPFWILALVLYYVGRELLLTGKKTR